MFEHQVRFHDFFSLPFRNIIKHIPPRVDVCGPALCHIAIWSRKWTARTRAAETLILGNGVEKKKAFSTTKRNGKYIFSRLGVTGVLYFTTGRNRKRQ